MTKKKKILALATALLMISICMVVLISQRDSGFPKQTINSQNNIDTIIVSGLIAEKDLPQLILESDMIVRCKVKEISEPIKIRPVTGGDYSIFTDFYIESISVLKGEGVFDDMTKIPVRIQGGKSDTLEVIAEDTPSLEVGNEYLLFLYRPGRGGGYNTKGDYFYVAGATQGSYTVVLNNELQHSRPQTDEMELVFVSQMDESKLTMSDLMQQINDY